MLSGLKSDARPPARFWVKLGLRLAVCLIALIALKPTPVSAQDYESARPVVQAELDRLLTGLPAERLANLGLAGAKPANVSLAAPLPVYSVRRDKLAQVGDKAWGGLFEPTDRVFFPVRVEGEERSGVWVERRQDRFVVTGVGDRRLAEAVAEAMVKIGPALNALDLVDQFEVRLVRLDWAACRLLAVLVRDKLFIWPLPTALKMTNLTTGLYQSGEMAQLLTGRSPAR